MGSRKIEFDKNLLLSKEDTSNLESGDKIRLMGLGNVILTKIERELEGKYIGDEMDVEYPKMQWIPEKNAHELKILVPKQLFIDDSYNNDSLEELLVKVEPHYLNLQEGVEIQFVRFGYCRKDSQNQAIYTHK